ncbi:ArdC-like ssDNA-binding domain-containing protein [uncultured Ilumatobacter sp.]|jgi:antirestriction protein ArdC|uniref:ArdC-like ssDNA-binding domain-containing protein n=1 Tax=uncultured Ilumatobacter sp. TaxID=879968 RepID=UPI00374F606C|tara:strand:+ start:868 stop:1194 length:327 start_codon:yes stop_codon:yes gene_type:complete
MESTRLGFARLPRTSTVGRTEDGTPSCFGSSSPIEGWSSSWATYRGWQRKDCPVRKGERGAQVVLWKPIQKKTDDEERTGSVFARAFAVFNAEQVVGDEPTAERSEVE